MKQKLSLRVLCRHLWIAVALCSATVASADITSNSIVTFQVDMTEQATIGLFTPGTDTVSVHGSFNGWGNGVQLTNNSAGANPDLYTGTLSDTQETNGAVTFFKYVIDNTSYEALPESGSDNRVANLPTNSGGSLVLPPVFFADDPVTGAVSEVTFQVDMSEQINLGKFSPATNTVEVRGSFNGWGGGDTMTQNTSGDTNIWTVTEEVDASTNAAQEFKYVIQPGTDWESLPNTSPNADYESGNRFFTSYTQTLPKVFFSEAPFISFSVTNDVTFILDMSVQEDIGAFTNSNPNNTVIIHGDFDGWGSGVTMTNNPNSSDPLLYYATIPYLGPPDATYNYKYTIQQPNTEWENLPNNGNRTFTTGRTNGNFTIGPDYFSLEAPSYLDDLVLITNSTVTFTVNMTNAVGNDNVTFNPSSDTVWLNGLNGGTNDDFWTWVGSGGVPPPQYQMTNIPNSMLYTLTLPVDLGQNINLTYKYGINGNDDEAGSGDNHTRYIRGFPSYQMPMDVFGSQGSTTSGEPSFGNLAATPQAGGVALTWLGRQHVHLQSTPSLTVPVWTPIIATDGTNMLTTPSGILTGTATSNYWTYTAKTNYPDTSGALFYRLAYP